MQIHSISKVLGLPFVLMALIILYYSSYVERSYSIYIFIPVFFIVALYVFHGVIDHWWRTKFPIKFDPKLRHWLNEHFPYYGSLPERDKSIFEYRLGIYIDARLFKSVGSELGDVPEDIKCMIAAHGIHMTLAQNDYLIGDTDRIYLYKHPFPTPDNQFLHTVETNVEDGVIILSIEQLTNSILYPSHFYNVAYHAYAEAFMGVHNTITFPDCEETWGEVEKVCGFSKETLIQQTGYQNLPLLPVHIACFFNNSDNYKQIFPKHYERFSQIFGQ
ncbi:MAG: zinc-dependent peptidase [Saprospiraceae bacterium]|nr:zinc-dependent peptidase [Saprospiraceae bacterium]